MEQKEETAKPTEKEKFPIDKLRIINVRINIDKLNGKYYKMKRREIRKKLGKLGDNGHKILINPIINKKIEEKWAVETLMFLQQEFTNLVIVPDTTVPDKELEEFIDFFTPQQVIRKV